MSNKELLEEARAQVEHLLRGIPEGAVKEATRKGEGADPRIALLVKLTVALQADAKALDYIVTRVTPDDYDNPSSALEAIGNAVERTGRTIEGEW